MTVRDAAGINVSWNKHTRPEGEEAADRIAGWNRVFNRVDPPITGLNNIFSCMRAFYRSASAQESKDKSEKTCFL